MNPKIKQIIENINRVVIGKQQQVKLAVTCLLANGHLLIEDLPGMGKTTLSHALAKTFGLDFHRVQFTSDLLPADILGVNIYDTTKQAFSFHPGPVFSQLLLADEINRSSPKTQSALLEAMEEHQVTVDGKTHQLPEPFFVIATQNPLHQSGTYPLPESQIDRFFIRIQIGYPDWQSEKNILMEKEDVSVTSLATIISQDELKQMQKEVKAVNASSALLDYVLRLVTLSRESDAYPNPLSPRASKALLLAAKAWAFINERDYVIPEDVQAIFAAVAEHRIRSSVSDMAGNSFSSQLLQQVDPLAA